MEISSRIAAKRQQTDVAQRNGSMSKQQSMRPQSAKLNAKFDDLTLRPAEKKKRSRPTTAKLHDTRYQPEYPKRKSLQLKQKEIIDQNESTTHALWSDDDDENGEVVDVEDPPKASCSKLKMNVVQAILLREECLKTLLSGIDDEWPTSRFLPLLSPLRMHSLAVTESILAWKAAASNRPFLWEGESYFKKMSRDTDQFESVLPPSIIGFSLLNNPFLSSLALDAPQLKLLVCCQQKKTDDVVQCIARRIQFGTEDTEIALATRVVMAMIAIIKEDAEEQLHQTLQPKAKGKFQLDMTSVGSSSPSPKPYKKRSSTRQTSFDCPSTQKYNKTSPTISQRSSRKKNDLNDDERSITINLKHIFDLCKDVTSAANQLKQQLHVLDKATIAASDPLAPCVASITGLNYPSSYHQSTGNELHEVGLRAPENEGLDSYMQNLSHRMAKYRQLAGESSESLSITKPDIHDQTAQESVEISPSCNSPSPHQKPARQFPTAKTTPLQNQSTKRNLVPESREVKLARQEKPRTLEKVVVPSSNIQRRSRKGGELSFRVANERNDPPLKASRSPGRLNSDKRPVDILTPTPSSRVSLKRKSTDHRSRCVLQHRSVSLLQRWWHRMRKRRAEYRQEKVEKFAVQTIESTWKRFLQHRDSMKGAATRRIRNWLQQQLTRGRKSACNLLPDDSQSQPTESQQLGTIQTQHGTNTQSTWRSLGINDEPLRRSSAIARVNADTELRTAWEEHCTRHNAASIIQDCYWTYKYNKHRASSIAQANGGLPGWNLEADNSIVDQYAQDEFESDSARSDHAPILNSADARSLMLKYFVEWMTNRLRRQQFRDLARRTRIHRLRDVFGTWYEAGRNDIRLRNHFKAWREQAYCEKERRIQTRTEFAQSAKAWKQLHGGAQKHKMQRLEATK